MLKKVGLRKIYVTTTALIIISMLYFFPSKQNEFKIQPKISYQTKVVEESVFLLDKYEYVSKIKIEVKQNQELIEKIKERLDILTISGKNQDIIPNGFKPLIPIDTKVLNLEVVENQVNINFSKEFLNIKTSEEDKVIESIVFTLTELEGIEKVNILVEGKVFTNFLNSKKIFKMPLNRYIGINKSYDLYSFKDLSYTTIYYTNKINNELYYTPVTKINNDNTEKINIIIDELKSSLVFESNLSSFLASSVELKDYEIKENIISLTFNDKIFDNIDTKKILEEVKYSISLSIKENYDVDEVIFYVSDEEILKMALKTLEY